jgi:hypothetical protein
MEGGISQGRNRNCLLNCSCFWRRTSLDEKGETVIGVVRSHVMSAMIRMIASGVCPDHGVVMQRMGPMIPMMGSDRYRGALAGMGDARSTIRMTECVLVREGLGRKEKSSLMRVSSMD